jgi:hypothetical protein
MAFNRVKINPKTCLYKNQKKLKNKSKKIDERSYKTNNLLHNS